jgi:hypothetical protein
LNEQGIKLGCGTEGLAYSEEDELGDAVMPMNFCGTWLTVEDTLEVGASSYVKKHRKTSCLQQTGN